MARKITIITLMFFTFAKLHAQDYQISFAGSGAATTVATVQVQNLTRGTSLTLNGSDILHLTVTTGIEQISSLDNSVRIYPNPMTSNSNIEFETTKAGAVAVDLFDMTSKKVASSQNILQAGSHTFTVIGLSRGVYFLSIKSANINYSGKIVSYSTGNETANLIYKQSTSKTTETSKLKGKKGMVDMQYTTGDRILFKGISGIYSTIKTLIPVASSTVTFNFVDATDADGNHYATVTIGVQTWMAENLKTTKYNNGVSIPNVTDNATWAALTTGAYCWYNNDITNKATYGALYNWFTVADARNIAPIGWHVPTNTQWTTLITYLSSETVAGGKMKETGTTHWVSPNTGAINESGFSALPCGSRDYDYGWFAYTGQLTYFWSSTESGGGSYGAYCSLRWDNEKCERNNLLKSAGVSVRCIKDASAQTFIPSLTTSVISNIAQTTATSGGNVTSDGGATVTARGVCWGTSSNPTTANNTTSNGSGTGSFISNITGLTANTTYYMRAYATNSAGTAYGNELIFKTLAAPSGTSSVIFNPNLTYGTMTDQDGNTYKTITIGTQTWMAENLRTTKYNNGDLIPNVPNATAWNPNLITGAYCNYNNTTDNNLIATYGRLYNWFALVDNRNIAPVGWHVPTDAEWTTLTTYLGGETVSGGKLKETGTTHWLSPNTGATNESGFSALPSGYRYGSGGTFYYLGNSGLYGTNTLNGTTGLWYRNMDDSYAGCSRFSNSKYNAYAVRLVKN